MREWEPREALVSEDGPAEVARVAAPALKPGGALALEVGDGQAPRGGRGARGARLPRRYDHGRPERARAHRRGEDRVRESFTTADGRLLSYEREGEGPLLVCHPGGPGFSSRYFGDLAGLGDVVHARQAQPARHRGLRPARRPARLRDGRLRRRPRGAARPPRRRAPRPARPLPRRRRRDGLRRRASRARPPTRAHEHVAAVPGRAGERDGGRDADEGGRALVRGRARRARGGAGRRVRLRRGARGARRCASSRSTSHATGTPSAPTSRR